MNSEHSERAVRSKNDYGKKQKIQCDRYISGNDRRHEDIHVVHLEEPAIEQQLSFQRRCLSPSMNSGHTQKTNTYW